jgi:UDP-N-acetylglucosamine 2-epimerase (non-hydrolysing)
MELLHFIVSAFEQIQSEVKLVFPIHPRTRNNIKGTELENRLLSMKNFMLTEPIGYLDFLRLMSNAVVVITDSGGIQEETTILGIPCITLRENTERPVTITEGTNQLVKITKEDIVQAYQQIRDKKIKKAKVPKFWDGDAAERIANIISQACE